MSLNSAGVINPICIFVMSYKMKDEFKPVAVSCLGLFAKRIHVGGPKGQSDLKVLCTAGGRRIKKESLANFLPVYSVCLLAMPPSPCIIQRTMNVFTTGLKEVQALLASILDCLRKKMKHLKQFTTLPSPPCPLFNPTSTSFHFVFPQHTSASRKPHFSIQQQEAPCFSLNLLRASVFSCAPAIQNYILEGLFCA